MTDTTTVQTKAVDEKTRTARNESFDITFGKWSRAVLAAEPRSSERGNPFSSGSEGFFAGGKVDIGGEKYQVTCSIVRIGSKPAK